LREIVAVRTLGDFELTRRLGAGGMGEVWMGRRAAVGGASKTVAIKILPQERAKKESEVEAFLGEARLSMLLSNANIVQVFEVQVHVDQDQEVPYMVMEWVDGLDLSDLTERLRKQNRKLPLHLVAYIIGEILKALDYAHNLMHEGTRRTIVHRDVSPHNVMVSVAGEVKLMDFGIARMSSEDTSGVHVKGKLRYMPPEQLRGRTREPTVDLFAVGAILHELLDGKKFRGSVEEEQLFDVILDGKFDPLSRPEDVPPTLDELRLGLLAANVADRIPSARVAFEKLEQWQGYRGAKFNLQDLVRSVVEAGTQPLAPEVTEKLPTNPPVLPASTGAQRDAATHNEPSPTGRGSDSNDASTQRDAQVVRSSEEQTGSEKRPRASVTGTISAIEARDNVKVRMRRGQAIVLSSLLALSGVGVGVFAVGSVAGWWVDDEVGPVQSADPEPARDGPPIEPVPKEPVQPDESSKIEEPEQPPLEKKAESTIEPPAKPEPDLPSGLGDEQPAPTETGTPEGKAPEPTPPPKVAKVPVILKADPKLNPWVEIKIGKEQYEIKKTGTQFASTKLRPQEYPVKYRTEFDGIWKDAGKVTIPKDGKVTVLIDAHGKATTR
jgi:serine/threonine protein kinase